MGDKSTIEWTDATWNPVTGCSKVSPGCAHCYAETLAARLHAMGQHGYTDLPWTPANAAENVTLRPERLDQPLRWRKPRVVFVNSMSDLFHELVPDEFIAAVFGVMAASPDHTFQILTKRPERMAAWFRWYQAECERLRIEPGGEARLALGNARQRVGPLDGLSLLGTPWPLPNVWLGVSIENRRYVDRADVLRETPAVVRFISAEPLLGPLVHERNEHGGFRSVAGHEGRCESAWSLAGRAAPYEGPQLDLTGIDWLIAGGESGVGHRPMRAGWVRDLRDACLETATSLHEAGCRANGRQARPAFFFKQWGGRTPKAGGRELDGRTWDEMPEVGA